MGIDNSFNTKRTLVGTLVEAGHHSDHLFAIQFVTVSELRTFVKGMFRFLAVESWTLVFVYNMLQCCE